MLIFFTRYLFRRRVRKKFNPPPSDDKCGLSNRTMRIVQHLGTRIYADAPKSETNCVGKHWYCPRRKNRRSVFTSRRPFWKVIYTVLSPGGTRARPSTKDLMLFLSLPPPFSLFSAGFSPAIFTRTPRHDLSRASRLAVGWSRVSALFAAAFQTSAVSLPLTRGVGTPSRGVG